MDIKEFRKLLQETMANSGILHLVDPRCLRDPVQMEKEIDVFLDKMVSKLYPLFGVKTQ